jgi:two-component system cell cycle sensor histidine kinase/response regulator CckA
MSPRRSRRRWPRWSSTATTRSSGLTPDGLVTAWNHGAEKLVGYTAAEMLGRPAAALADQQGAVHQQDVLAGIRKGEGGRSYEARRLRRNGTAVDLALTVTPIVDQAEAMIGISVIARDITTVKEAAEQQRVVLNRLGSAMHVPGTADRSSRSSR